MSIYKNSETENQACSCVQCTCNYLAQELTKLLIQGCAGNCSSFERTASEQRCLSHSRQNQSADNVTNLRHSDDRKCPEAERACTKCHCSNSFFIDGNSDNCKAPVAGTKKDGCSKCDCSQININENYHLNNDNSNRKDVNCKGPQGGCDSRTNSKCICCNNPKMKTCECADCKCSRRTNKKYNKCCAPVCRCSDCRCNHTVIRETNYTQCHSSQYNCSNYKYAHCFNNQCDCSDRKCSDSKRSDCRCSHYSNNQCDFSKRDVVIAIILIVNVLIADAVIVNGLILLVTEKEVLFHNLDVLTANVPNLKVQTIKVLHATATAVPN